MAKFDDFIESTDEELQMQIGEKGSKLSGGQRQRLGIARALLTKPKLIVLDEATSALDAQVEANLSASINELRGFTTILIVAHRLSTVRSADQVIYMENGSIVTAGTFSEVRESVPNFEKQAKLMGL
jgi:ABC-type bacteriocin/lantibiotic exporter with double-glycine peptidase domain